MKLKAWNKRLRHTTEVKAVDLVNNKVQLVQPKSNPIFIYTEKLENVNLLEFTGVTLGGVDIYVNDIVRDGIHKYKVEKVPGGYLPFILPVRKDFKNEL